MPIFGQHASLYDARLFSIIYNLRGSVATRFRCVGMFNDHFIESVRESMSVKEVWKSAGISSDIIKTQLCDQF